MEGGRAAAARALSTDHFRATTGISGSATFNFTALNPMALVLLLNGVFRWYKKGASEYQGYATASTMRLRNPVVP